MTDLADFSSMSDDCVECGGGHPGRPWVTHVGVWAHSEAVWGLLGEGGVCEPRPLYYLVMLAELGAHIWPCDSRQLCQSQKPN